MNGRIENVGELKEILKDISDDTPLIIVWLTSKGKEKSAPVYNVDHHGDGSPVRIFN